MHFETSRGEFTISTDPARQDVDAIHAFLARSYWAQGVAREVVAQAVQHSLCFGLFHRGRQVGFGRVITDRATYGYVADVYVLEEFRGRGLGEWLVECIVNHPDLQVCRKLALATRDAHGLYARFGFQPLARPQDYLERRPRWYRAGQNPPPLPRSQA
ncbi:MAG: GNAT family N-acetyltransferase [Verrucomicrobia bacterium]|nr:GNAT family N-acetyltransferase [Verrucomicrobiota bacterium]